MATRKQRFVSPPVEESVPTPVVEEVVEESPIQAPVYTKEDVDEAWRGLHNFLSMFQSVQYLKDHVAGIKLVVDNADLIVANSKAIVHAQQLVENDLVERLAALKTQIEEKNRIVKEAQVALDDEIEDLRRQKLEALEVAVIQLTGTRDSLLAEIENLRELRIRRETEEQNAKVVMTEELTALENRITAAREKLETLRHDIAAIMKEN